MQTTITFRNLEATEAIKAYALAKVCRREQALFGCAKYITDGADHSAATDWQANLEHAAAAFVRLYATVGGRFPV